jgi:hypothetical protein
MKNKLTLIFVMAIFASLLQSCSSINESEYGNDPHSHRAFDDVLGDK